MSPRRLVLLAGSQPWAESVTQQAVECWRARQLRVLRADRREPPRKAWMGQDLDAVVLTSRRRRFLDSFGAVCGALRGGGVLLLQTPPLELWRGERLGARWCGLLEELQTQTLTEGSELPAWEGLVTPKAEVALEPNAEQLQLIDRILKIRPSRPLVIIGRRGRGKSACLGMAAALLLQRQQRVVVTSPSREASNQLFWAAEKFLQSPKLRVGRHSLRWGKNVLDFQEAHTLRRPDLRESFLIIDEAAGFPVNFTAGLLESAGRVLLATTLDGYEGSGNGFPVRAVPRLKQLRPNLEVVELQTSWRWRERCPLEALSRVALLLDAAPVEVEREEVGEGGEGVELVEVEQRALGEDELKSLYGLLRVGHYKTKPSDLETFLDAKGIIWLALKKQEKYLGVTISGVEDPVHDTARAQELWLGRCQLPQKLTAQTLSRDAGLPEATELRYVRMMRWCLHPKLRGLGLGERLLAESVQSLRASAGAGADALAAHFGATAWLMKLWQRQGAQVVFVSHGCDPSSGQHSISVLIPLTVQAWHVVQRLQERLAKRIWELLSGPLADLEAEAVRELLLALPLEAAESEEAQELWSYAFGARSLSHTSYALRKCLGRALRSGRTQNLAEREKKLIMSLLQGRPILSEDQLRQVLRKLLSTSLPFGEPT